MGFPVVTGVMDFKPEGSKAIVQLELGGGTREVLEIKTPCIIGATKGLNEPRYPKLPDILKAKKKEIKKIALEELGIDNIDLCRLKKLDPVEERSNARILEGPTDEIVASLVKILKEEEKVI
ncbi:MAG: hypothetical protein JRE58_15355 [Deltaproteobacteria bacterium]|nr:hypothetical protein [Deltaproteobacteria bacterium]